MYTLPPFFERKNCFIRLLYLLFFVLGGMIIFNLLGQLIATAIWGDSILQTQTAGYIRLSQLFNAIGTFLFPALLFSYCSQRKFFHYADAHLTPPPQTWFYVIILAFTLLPVISFFLFLNMQMTLPDSLAPVEQWMREMEESSNNLLAILTQEHQVSVLLLNLLICAVIPAICEEFFFRGTLQQLLLQWFNNKHIAIIVTAFVFSAIHLQFFGFIPRFLLGLYLGYLFVWSKSIWLPIAAHFLHNAISIVMQYVSAPTNPDVANEYVVAQELPWLIIGLIISVWSLYRLWKIYQKNNNAIISQ